MIAPAVTGIVLAGGKSSRMGEDKSLLNLNGKSLIEYSISALKPLCKEVIISSNQFVYDFTGCAVWPDEMAIQAPMIGIYSCLKRSTTDLNIVLTCDMPMVTTDFLAHLLANSEGVEITVPVRHGSLEPLCGIYRKSAINSLNKCILEGDFSMRKGIRLSSHRLINLESDDFANGPNLFWNINTPADFAAISGWLKSIP